MLWDLIRDFFVMHVFGGITSTDDIYECFLGNAMDSNTSISTNMIRFQVGTLFDGPSAPFYISLADWLSTTATAISITIIVVLCCLFVYKIIKLIGGLIR